MFVLPFEPFVIPSADHHCVFKAVFKCSRTYATSSFNCKQTRYLVALLNAVLVNDHDVVMKKIQCYLKLSKQRGGRFLTN